MSELCKHNVICTNVKCVKDWLKERKKEKRKRKEKRAWLKIIKKQTQRTSKSVQIYFKLLFQANLSNILMPVLKYYICWFAHVTIVQVQQKINYYYRLQRIFFQMLTSDQHFTQCLLYSHVHLVIHPCVYPTKLLWASTLGLHHWWCTCGGVYVPCIYMHARWELL